MNALDQTAFTRATEKPFFLRDIYDLLPEDERDEFRETARDFAYGLEATIAGARRAMRQWVAKPRSWISGEWQQRRKRFLAKLDAFVEAQEGGA